ncbi:hypothetical protein BH20ACT23_BH20ACT23_22730 [soil metagenome]
MRRIQKRKKKRRHRPAPNRPEIVDRVRLGQRIDAAIVEIDSLLRAHARPGSGLGTG